MSRTLIVISIVILLLLPFGIFALRSPALHNILPPFLQGQQKEVTGTHFGTISDVPGYTVKLVDTQYLDYMVSKLGILSDQVVVDPRCQPPIVHTNRK